MQAVVPSRWRWSTALMAMAILHVAETATNVGAHDIIWHSPSMNSSGSVPLGNGDLAANVWVDGKGDVQFLLAKSDSWSEASRLLKLGLVTISILEANGRPSPFLKADFLQTLHLSNETLRVVGGGVTLEAYIDASMNTLRAEISSPDRDIDTQASVHIWRTETRGFRPGEEESAEGARCFVKHVYPDTLLSEPADSLIWYHRNKGSVVQDVMKLQQSCDDSECMRDPLLNRTFGAAVRGQTVPNKGETLAFKRISNRTLQSELRKTGAGARYVAEARRQHSLWWEAFWARSYIDFGCDAGDSREVCKVERGWVLERYMQACAGRGQQPMKFNGNLFTVDWRQDSRQFDYDYRRWGGMYWWQNTRLLYWGMLVSGDLDLMLPLFEMYRSTLPVHKSRVENWYGHAGASFPEVMHFWGAMGDTHYGCDRRNKPVWRVDNNYIRELRIAGLELLAMALDYFAFTKNTSFARDVVIPFANETITFYVQHYGLDKHGKLDITPAQCLETLHKAINPITDVAGLHHTLRALLDSLSELLPPDAIEFFAATLQRVPDIPLMRLERHQAEAAPSTPASRVPSSTQRDETRTAAHHDALPWESKRMVLAPAHAWEEEAENVENPELYAVFPFRIFQFGRTPVVPVPLSVAIDSYFHRRVAYDEGWMQSSIQAAALGLAKEAMQTVTERFTKPALRFPGFYQMTFFCLPATTNGEVARLALQHMLLQYSGRQILLFPAWPADVDVRFKLHAPLGTVVEASCVAGVASLIRVSPPERVADISLPGQCQYRAES